MSQQEHLFLLSNLLLTVACQTLLFNQMSR